MIRLDVATREAHVPGTPSGHNGHGRRANFKGVGSRGVCGNSRKLVYNPTRNSLSGTVVPILIQKGAVGMRTKPGSMHITLRPQVQKGRSRRSTNDSTPTMARTHLLLASVLLLPALATCTTTSRWSAVPQAPPDPILGVATAYNADPAEMKVNLGIGAYRNNEGKPIVLRCVREAEKKIANDETAMKEYLPIQVNAPCITAKQIHQQLRCDPTSQFLWFCSDRD
eukprot:1694826-Rhodomonas_salina.2